MSTKSDRPREPEASPSGATARSAGGLPASVRTIIALAVCCAAVYLAVWQVWKSSNPVLAAARGLRSGDPAQRLAAIQEVSELGLRYGTEAIPPLLETLKDPNADVRALAAKHLSIMSSYGTRARGDTQGARTVAAALFELLKDPEPRVRIEATRGLENLGSEFTSRRGGGRKAGAAPPASKLVDSKAFSDALIGLLGDPDVEVRAEAMHGLGTIAPRLSIDPPEALVAALKDPAPANRAAAASAVVHFRKGLDPIVGTLTGMLEHDKVSEVRDACAHSLGQIHAGALSAAAVPALVAALHSKDANARLQLVTLLARLSSDARRLAIPAFISELKEPVDTDLRDLGGTMYLSFSGPLYVAADALGKTAPGTPSAKEAVAALTQVVQSGHPQRAAAAAKALGTFGKDAESAVPAVVKMLQNTSFTEEPTRDGAALAEALGKIAADTGAAGEAARGLTAALQAKSELTREAAIKALAKLGPKEAAGAIPRIRSLEHDDPTPKVRSAAASFLGTHKSGD